MGRFLSRRIAMNCLLFAVPARGFPYQLLAVIINALSPHYREEFEMRFRVLAASSVLSVFCLGMCADSCCGQGSNQFGQGGGGSNSGGFGSFGGSGRGQSRSGTGYGNNTTGASRGGMGGAGFGAGYGTGGFAGGQGQGQGQQQSALGNNQAGIAPIGGFIGGAQDTQNFFRSLNGQRQGAAMFDSMIENLNDMRESRGNDGSDRSPPVRVQLRPAFETPLGTIARVNADVQTRLASTVTDLGVADPQITMEGRTIRLEGRVKSAHERELVEKLISLEPGVTEIDNRLTVDLPTPPQ
jgi:hypothetical protein